MVIVVLMCVFFGIVVMNVFLLDGLYLRMCFCEVKIGIFKEFEESYIMFLFVFILFLILIIIFLYVFVGFVILKKYKNLGFFENFLEF